MEPLEAGFEIPVEEGVLEPETPEQESPATDFTVEQRAALGEYVARQFSDAEVIRDADREHVWRRNRDDYANKPIRFLSKFNEDAQDIPVNLASTKAEALRDLVTGALFATRPYVTASVQGMESGEVYKLERIMQNILEAACIEERVKESSEDAWCTNHAIFRVCWSPETLTYEIDTIDPEDFVVAGGDKFGITNSVLVGHSYWARRADIEYEIEDGTSFPYIDGLAYDPESNADPLEEVRLAQLFVRFDEKRLKKDGVVRPVGDWHLLTLDIDRKHILKLEKFTIADRPWYFSASYMPSKRKGMFWSKHSLGAFMQGPHVAYQITFNTAIYGAVGTALPPTFIEGEFTDQADRPKWGQVSTTYGGNVTAPWQKFDPSDLEPTMARTERIGDGVARVSQVAGGQTFNKGMTATEAQLIAQATDQGVSGYVSTYAISFEELVAYIYGTLKYTHQAVLQGMDESLVPADPMALFMRGDIKWVATGRGQYASPALKMAQLDKVVEMSRAPELIGKFDPVEIAESQLALMNLPNKDRLFDRTRPLPPPPPGIPLGQASQNGGNGPAPEPPNSGGSGDLPAVPGGM